MQFTFNITRGHLMSSAKILTLGLLLGFGIQFIFAWTAPSVSAPGGNVAGPITTTLDPTAYQMRAAGIGLTGSINVSNILTATPPQNNKITAPKFCINNDGTDTNCLTSWSGLGGGIGDGQTWTDVNGSRNLNQSYVNSTGRPIMVSVTLYAGPSGSVGGPTANVDGVFAAGDSSGGAGGVGGGVTFIVPAGSTYVVYGSGYIAGRSWSELR